MNGKIYSRQIATPKIAGGAVLLSEMHDIMTKVLVRTVKITISNQ